MAKYSYGGLVLPDINSVWTDKTTYPYAIISASQPIMGMGFGLYHLYVVDKQGYIEVDADTNTNIYTLGLLYADDYDATKALYARAFVIAINSDVAASNESLYPGISADAWLETTISSDHWGGDGYCGLPCNSGPHWSNVTLYDQDGNLFLEASEPVEIKGFDLRSFLTGLALGLSGKPLPLANKEPIAYLYNGVQLPKLPEWDRVKYPYAVVVKKLYPVPFKYQLYCASTEIVEGINGVGEPTGCFNIPGGDYIVSDFVPSGVDGWGDFKEESGQELLTAYTFVWTNTDLYYNDGTLYLAASDPIPVYE